MADKETRSPVLKYIPKYTWRGQHIHMRNNLIFPQQHAKKQRKKSSVERCHLEKANVYNDITGGRETEGALDQVSAVYTFKTCFIL